MEPLVVQMYNKDEYALLYASAKFVDSVVVTGYLIYPDATKSDIFIFDNLGDGIFRAIIPNIRFTEGLEEKHGLLVKEDDKPTYFRLIRIVN